MRTNRRSLTIVVMAFLMAAVVRCAGVVEPVSPKILLSNDDGIDAPGLAALFEALQKVGTVTVAAPAREQSGISHGMTTRRLIPVQASERKGAKWFAIDATPGSCVRLALESLLAEKPDIVVSGANQGENLGLVTFYSATVAAARAAAFLRIPAISVNLQRGPEMDYGVAGEFTAALVRELARKGFKKGMLLNVNVPALPRNKIKGIKITRQDPQPTVELFEKKESRDGQDFYWPSYKILEAGPVGTDTWAVRNGYISISPFTLDQSDAAAITAMKGLEKLNWK